MLNPSDTEKETKFALAVNATSLLSPFTGIANYVVLLMNALQTPAISKKLFFYGSSWSDQIRRESNSKLVTQLRRSVRQYLPKAYELRRWSQQKLFSRGVRMQKPDLYHEPSSLAYDFDGALVLTVHDLSWIRFPETHPKERVRVMNKYFERSLTAAAQVITDSDFIKQELLSTFSIPAAKVTAIHLAADLLYKPRGSDEIGDLLKQLKLSYRGYWIAVGTLEPRKNLGLTLEAFKQLNKADRRRCPLVVVGGLGWNYDSYLRDTAELKAEGSLLQLGYINQKDLAQLLAGAKALVYPSKYEGFGLPIAEAMQCGTPVISSMASCLPEVLDYAGVVVEPADSVALANVFRRLIDDPVECERLGNLSLKRSSDFSWQKCAHQTLCAYRKALAS